MSASLVGSEMCIRDRKRCCAFLVVLQALGEPLPGSSTRRQCGGRWGWGAVSYTHLTLPTICSV
eukprot:1812168-Alexandrium_andersonii.AAC.1